MTADIALKYGHLQLQALELQVPEGVEANKLEVVASGRSVSCAVRREGGRVVIRLDEPVMLSVAASFAVMLFDHQGKGGSRKSTSIFPQHFS